MKVNITAVAAALSMELDEDMEVGTVALLAAAEIGEESTQVSVLECTSCVSCECRLCMGGVVVRGGVRIRMRVCV